MRKVLHLNLSKTLISLAGLPPIAFADVSDIFSNVVSDFDRTMATFNPVGEYFREPLERALPDLSVQGRIKQWTDILINPDKQLGYGGKGLQDYRFAQLQNLLELKTSYAIFPGLDFKAVTHAMYDGAYDWQQSKGLYANRINETAERYNTTDRIMRELYVSYRTAKYDVIVGKQQVIWGKMDGQFIDIINGMDRREGPQLETEDYELRRLPAWMINTTLHFGDSSLQLLDIISHEQDQQSLPGSPWYSPLYTPSAPGGDVTLPWRRPHTGNLDNQEFAMRFDRAAGAMTYGFIYAYLWDKNPVDRIIGTEGQGAATRLLFQPQVNRLNHFGVTADYSTTLPDVPLVGAVPTVFRLEALYTLGVRFTDSNLQAAARAGDAGTDGTVRHDTFRAAIAAEFGLPGNTTFIMQPSLYYTFGWNPALSYGFGGGIENQWTLIPVFYLSHPFAFTRDRLTVNYTLYPVFGGPEITWQGVKSKLRISYKISQFLTTDLVYNSYGGGPDSGLYGQYKKWDNVGWEINYAF